MMNRKLFLSPIKLTGTCLSILIISCSPKSTPQAAAPAVAAPQSFKPAAALPTVESLPLSELDIPVTIDLRSF